MTAVLDRRDEVVRTYFVGCNDADATKIASCLTDDAVHYFPPGMYGGPWRGASLIAENWCSMVARIGSTWALEQVLISPDGRTGVAEWTHYKTTDGTVLRGDEWYVFDEQSGLISEIRAYYASPQDQTRNRMELEGFDYGARGYSTEQPPVRAGRAK
jgi:methyltransferase